MINTGIELLNGEQALLTLYIQGAMLYFVSPTLVALTIVYTIRQFRNRKKQKDTKDKMQKAQKKQNKQQSSNISPLNYKDEVITDKLSIVNTDSDIKPNSLNLEFNEDGSIKQ